MKINFKLSKCSRYIRFCRTAIVVFGLYSSNYRFIWHTSYGVRTVFVRLSTFIVPFSYRCRVIRTRFVAQSHNSREKQTQITRYIVQLSYNCRTTVVLVVLQSYGSRTAVVSRGIRALSRNFKFFC